MKREFGDTEAEGVAKDEGPEGSHPKRGKKGRKQKHRKTRGRK